MKSHISRLDLQLLNLN